MYKFPIQISKNRRVSVTQQFKSTALVGYYRQQGLNVTAHAGVDVVCGSPVETYGAAIVCPFPHAMHVRSRMGTVMGPEGNTLVVRYENPAGKRFELLLHHLSGIERSYPYEYGEVMCYIGNSGLVLPKPTPAAPYNGAHLHMELRVDSALVDPLHYFNLRDPFVGPDTSRDYDMPPLSWALAQLRATFAALLPK